ncbi:unnamed protein product [Lactuca virosa]|uniref:NmrA-like domain-containing protein n=1 Tax=Lactuca virosa TaxID=75947 RepID=A0AAU9LT66_9ASTR|nr:unnamed protein product [Lactuca virosa]
MMVRKTIKDFGIPFTYVSANCFVGYMVGGLCQLSHILPSRESVLWFGDYTDQGYIQSGFGVRFIGAKVGFDAGGDDSFDEMFQGGVSGNQSLSFGCFDFRRVVQWFLLLAGGSNG